MIEIGKYNKLKAIRLTPPGMYLGKENEKEVVLLPNKFIPNDFEVNQEIEVFIYNDSEDRIIATTQEPKIKLHEFACLEVKDVNRNGAFLDWGLEKDLMVPYSEQQVPMREGEYYLVYLYFDDKSNRLVATSKIDRFLEKEQITVKPGDQVDLLIGEDTDLGMNVIINNIHKGLIYHNEIFRDIYPGDRIAGYVKQVREDKKIDVSLQQQGYGNIDPSAEIILEKLRTSDGFLNLNDDSDPEDIQEELQMSKKTFKKAIGALYKQRLIVIEEDGIRLVDTAKSSGKKNI
jgi:predicted RNA-binding protein (virulence factor B family)